MGGSGKWMGGGDPVGLRLAPPEASDRITPFGEKREPPIGAEFPSMISSWWRRIEILFFLSQSRMKSYAHDRILGFLWWVFDPLFQILIYVFLMDVILRSGQPRFPLFLACAVIPWRFLVHGSSAAGVSLLSNAGLLKSINIDRICMPVSEVLNSLINFLYALPTFGVLMALYGVAPTVHLLWIPVILVVQVVLVIGLGLILSVWSVVLRDVENLWMFLLQAWFFLSPTLYPPEQVPERLRGVFLANPAVGIIEGYRAAILYGRPPDARLLLISAAAAVAVFGLGIVVFRRSENEAMRLL
jgi:ABC-type polysaccharide/polyol phosphate export permease